jgi:hypothetical protein
MALSCIASPVMATVKWIGGNMSNYGDQFMKCPECGSRAEAECVDVGVGLYINDEYESSCGWNSAAHGRMNVATYDDRFVCYPLADACRNDMILLH